MPRPRLKIPARLPIRLIPDHRSVLAVRIRMPAYPRHTAAALFLLLTARQVAAAETASIEVGLVIRDSCLVQHDLPARSAHTPMVSCSLDSPYQVQPGTLTAPVAQASAPQPSVALAPSLWQVTF